jgi:hypothetical protein
LRGQSLKNCVTCGPRFGGRIFCDCRGFGGTRRGFFVGSGRADGKVRGNGRVFRGFRGLLGANRRGPFGYRRGLRGLVGLVVTVIANYYVAHRALPSLP